MGLSKWILVVIVAFGLVSLSHATTRPSWDIPFQLNRNYGLTAMNSDLNFPMDITTPSDGLLYSIPAQTLFSDKRFPEEPLYMQLNFQPNLSLTEFYFLTIRDPDGVLRFSLSMYKRQIYGVQLRYHLLDSDEEEKTIDFPFPQSPSYWRLGVWIKEDSIDFFTNCPRLQTAPFHEEKGIKLLGRPLFRDGASAFLLNSGVRTNPMYFQGVLTEFTLHSGSNALQAPCKTTEQKEESGEPIYTFDPDFGNVIISCHYFPIIDLSDGSVRIFDPTSFTILMDSQVKDGEVVFTNGTRMQLCENFVKADEGFQRTVVVNLRNGIVELRDLSGRRKAVYSNVTSGFRLERSTPRVRPVLVWRNVTAVIDTWKGSWIVKLPGSDQFERVVKIEDGIISMPSGYNVSILLKIKNPKYALTLEPHWGTVSVYRKSTGHLYGRVIYDLRIATSDKPEETSGLMDALDSSGSPNENLDVSMPTRSATTEIHYCQYVPAIDLTNGTIYLYDNKRRKVLIDSEVRDGIVHFSNGSSFEACETFVAFDDPEASITMVNLTTGESFLLDRDEKKNIYKSDVFRGFPPKFSALRTIITWKNVKVQIDTRNGNWIVEDPENGQLTKARNIVNGKIIMPVGDAIPIQLKIFNKDYSLILEPSVGLIGVYKKSDGELYGRVFYNQRSKRDLQKTTSTQGCTTFIPLQQTDGLVETTPFLEANFKNTKMGERLVTMGEVFSESSSDLPTELKPASFSEKASGSTMFSSDSSVFDVSGHAVESKIASDGQANPDNEASNATTVVHGEWKSGTKNEDSVKTETTLPATHLSLDSNRFQPETFTEIIYAEGSDDSTDEDMGIQNIYQIEDEKENTESTAVEPGSEPTSKIKADIGFTEHNLSNETTIQLAEETASAETLATEGGSTSAEIEGRAIGSDFSTDSSTVGPTELAEGEVTSESHEVTPIEAVEVGETSSSAAVAGELKESTVSSASSASGIGGEVTESETEETASREGTESGERRGADETEETTSSESSEEMVKATESTSGGDTTSISETGTIEGSSESSVVAPDTESTSTVEGGISEVTSESAGETASAETLTTEGGSTSAEIEGRAIGSDFSTDSSTVGPTELAEGEVTSESHEVTPIEAVEVGETSSSAAVAGELKESTVSSASSASGIGGEVTESETEETASREGTESGERRGADETEETTSSESSEEMVKATESTSGGDTTSISETGTIEGSSESSVVAPDTESTSTVEGGISEVTSESAGETASAETLTTEGGSTSAEIEGRAIGSDFSTDSSTVGPTELAEGEVTSESHEVTPIEAVEVGETSSSAAVAGEIKESTVSSASSASGIGGEVTESETEETASREGTESGERRGADETEETTSSESSEEMVKATESTSGGDTTSISETGTTEGSSESSVVAPDTESTSTVEGGISEVTSESAGETASAETLATEGGSTSAEIEGRAIGSDFSTDSSTVGPTELAEGEVTSESHEVTPIEAVEVGETSSSAAVAGELKESTVSSASSASGIGGEVTESETEETASREGTESGERRGADETEETTSSESSEEMVKATESTSGGDTTSISETGTIEGSSESSVVAPDTESTSTVEGGISEVTSESAGETASAETLATEGGSTSAEIEGRAIGSDFSTDSSTVGPTELAEGEVTSESHEVTPIEAVEVGETSSSAAVAGELKESTVSSASSASGIGGEVTESETEETASREGTESGERRGADETEETTSSESSEEMVKATESTSGGDTTSISETGTTEGSSESSVVAPDTESTSTVEGGISEVTSESAGETASAETLATEGGSTSAEIEGRAIGSDFSTDSSTVGPTELAEGEVTSESHEVTPIEAVEVGETSSSAAVAGELKESTVSSASSASGIGGEVTESETEETASREGTESGERRGADETEETTSSESSEEMVKATESTSGGDTTSISETGTIEGSSESSVVAPDTESTSTVEGGISEVTSESAGETASAETLATEGGSTSAEIEGRAIGSDFSTDSSTVGPTELAEGEVTSESHEVTPIEAVEVGETSSSAAVAGELKESTVSSASSASGIGGEVTESETEETASREGTESGERRGADETEETTSSESSEEMVKATESTSGGDTTSISETGTIEGSSESSVVAPDTESTSTVEGGISEVTSESAGETASAETLATEGGSTSAEIEGRAIGSDFSTDSSTVGPTELAEGEVTSESHEVTPIEAVEVGETSSSAAVAGELKESTVSSASSASGIGGEVTESETEETASREGTESGERRGADETEETTSSESSEEMVKATESTSGGDTTSISETGTIEGSSESSVVAPDTESTSTVEGGISEVTSESAGETASAETLATEGGSTSAEIEGRAIGSDFSTDSSTVGLTELAEGEVTSESHEVTPIEAVEVGETSSSAAVAGELKESTVSSASSASGIGGEVTESETEETASREGTESGERRGADETEETTSSESSEEMVKATESTSGGDTTSISETGTTEGSSESSVVAPDTESTSTVEGGISEVTSESAGETASAETLATEGGSTSAEIEGRAIGSDFSTDSSTVGPTELAEGEVTSESHEVTPIEAVEVGETSSSAAVAGELKESTVSSASSASGIGGEVTESETEETASREGTESGERRGADETEETTSSESSEEMVKATESTSGGDTTSISETGTIEGSSESSVVAPDTESTSTVEGGISEVTSESAGETASAETLATEGGSTSAEIEGRAIGSDFSTDSSTVGPTELAEGEVTSESHEVTPIEAVEVGETSSSAAVAGELKESTVSSASFVVGSVESSSSSSSIEPALVTDVDFTISSSASQIYPDTSTSSSEFFEGDSAISQSTGSESAALSSENISTSSAIVISSPETTPSPIIYDTMIVTENVETTTAEPIVEVGSQPASFTLIKDITSSPDTTSFSSLGSTPAQISSTSPLAIPGDTCDPKIIMMCKMLSQAIIASGLQVTLPDDDDTFTTTSAITTTTPPVEESSTTSEPTATTFGPDTTTSEEDEDVTTPITLPYTATSSLSTMISFTSVFTGKPDLGYLIPLLDLSDMTVKVLNIKENHLVPNARIENGYLQFENGTSTLIQDVQGILPSEKAASNVMISVDLHDGITSLVNLDNGEVIMSRNSSEGIPLETMRNYSEGALIEVLTGNTVIQVDTYNGRWTVQNASTGTINLVQEVKDGFLYLDNGEKIEMPSTGKENEAVAIDAITGMVRTINKETGEVRISYPTTDSSTVLSEGTMQEVTEGMTSSVTEGPTSKEGITKEEGLKTSEVQEDSYLSTPATDESSSSSSASGKDGEGSTNESASSMTSQLHDDFTSAVPSGAVSPQSSEGISTVPSHKHDDFSTEISGSSTTETFSSDEFETDINEGITSEAPSASPESASAGLEATASTLTESNLAMDYSTPQMENYTTIESETPFASPDVVGGGSDTTESGVSESLYLTTVYPTPQMENNTTIESETPFASPDVVGGGSDTTESGVSESLYLTTVHPTPQMENNTTIESEIPFASPDVVGGGSDTTESGVSESLYLTTVHPTPQMENNTTIESEIPFASPDVVGGGSDTTESGVSESLYLTTVHPTPQMENNTTIETATPFASPDVVGGASDTAESSVSGSYDYTTVYTTLQMENFTKIESDVPLDGEGGGSDTTELGISDSYNLTTDGSTSQMDYYTTESETSFAPSGIKDTDLGTAETGVTEPHRVMTGYSTSQTANYTPTDSLKLGSDEYTDFTKQFDGNVTADSGTVTEPPYSEDSKSNLTSSFASYSSENPVSEKSTRVPFATEGDYREEVGEYRPYRSVATEVDKGTTDFPKDSNSVTTYVSLQPDCECLDRLLTPELVEKLRESDFIQPESGERIYDELFKTPSFLRVVKEVIGEYFERPGIVERYRPPCDCPVNNDCVCPAPETAPFNVSSSSKHILGALKDMSNGAIIMNNKTSLAKVAFSLAPGSMVYLKAEDMFYLKVDDRENIWRTIDMNTQSESVRIPEPSTTTTTTAKPTLAQHLIGKSLMLIAHNDPLDGELRFGAKLNGGHSSAIFACQRAARRHNISHVFYPLMSTDMFNMDYVVPPMYRYDMPIINRNGEILFDDFMHMIKGEQVPLASLLTFAGHDLGPDPSVPCAWIGAKPIYLNGDYDYAARSKCRNWQTRDPIETGLAAHIPMNGNATGFLDQSNLYDESCAKRCSVLCIQILPN
ncbi:hypothetical protein Aperf_G00000060811 [Anoplocephala perfoliata]